MVILSIAAVVAPGGCGDPTYTRDDFWNDVEAAKACAPGDTCARLSLPWCGCDELINSRELARLEAIAERLGCSGPGVFACPEIYEPECTEGTCQSGPPPPPPCNPIGQLRCDEGEKCAFVLDDPMTGDGHPGCVPDGDLAIGEACEQPVDVGGADGCVATAQCWYGACRPMCRIGATECPDGYRCTRFFGWDFDVCLPACDPLAQDCAPGPGGIPTGCYLQDRDFGNPVCLPVEGFGGPGQPCSALNDCTPGYSCYYHGSGDYRCHAYCDYAANPQSPDPRCLPGDRCELVALGVDIGRCGDVDECDALLQDCPAGEACWPDVERMVCVSVVEPTRAPGSPCLDAPSSCEPGSVCVQQGPDGEMICMTLCELVADCTGPDGVPTRCGCGGCPADQACGSLGVPTADPIGACADPSAIGCDCASTPICP